MPPDGRRRGHLTESLLAIARSVKTFRGQSSLSTWIFTIARRFCIKRRRQASATASAARLWSRSTKGVTDDLPAGDPTPYEQAKTGEAWRQVHAALSGSNPEAREVLVLRDIEGLSAREVAQVVGASVSAVKSRLHQNAASCVSAWCAPTVSAIGDLPRHPPGLFKAPRGRTLSEHVYDPASPHRRLPRLRSRMRRSYGSAQKRALRRRSRSPSPFSGASSALRRGACGHADALRAREPFGERWL